MRVVAKLGPEIAGDISSCAAYGLGKSSQMCVICVKLKLVACELLLVGRAATVDGCCIYLIRTKGADAYVWHRGLRRIP